jgi:hypothetical protein
MEAARTSETLVNFYQTTRRYNTKDSHLHTRRRENLKSQNLVRLSHLPHSCYMPRLSHLPWFCHPNSLWWRVQRMEILLQFSPAYHHFIPLSPKCSTLFCSSSQIPSICVIPLKTTFDSPRNCRKLIWYQYSSSQPRNKMAASASLRRR